MLYSNRCTVQAEEERASDTIQKVIYEYERFCRNDIGGAFSHRAGNRSSSSGHCRTKKGRFTRCK